LELSDSQRHRTSSTSTASQRLLHPERSFSSIGFFFYWISLFATDNLSQVEVFRALFYFPLSHSRRSSGFRMYFFLSGKHLHWVVAQISIFIYHTTTWLDPGRVFGCIYNWAGNLIQAVCSLSFTVLFFSFGFIRKEEHAAMHNARLSPRQKTPLDSRFPDLYHLYSLNPSA
jgi:hypothetical protein